MRPSRARSALERRPAEAGATPARCKPIAAVLAALCSPGALACGDEASPPLRLELAAGHRAAVISVGSPQLGPLVAWDLEAPLDAPLLEALPEAGRLPATALYYDAPLARLGLVAGPLDRVGAGLPLPPPTLVQVADIERGVNPTWRTEPDMPEGLAALRVARESPCARFTVQSVDLPFQTAVHDVELGPDGAAWVLAAGGALWRVVPDAAPTRVLEGLPDRVLVVERPGVLWAGGWAGGLARIELQGVTATVTASRSIVADTLHALAVAPGGGPPIFAVTSARALLGGGPTDWVELGRVDADLGDPRGVLAFGPDEALMGFEDGLLAYRWREGRLREESVPAAAFDSGLTAFLSHPGLGTVIGTAVGELLLRPAGAEQWVRLDGAYSTADVEDLAPYGDGFVYVDERGVLVQYIPGFGFCEQRTPPASATAEGIQLVADGEDLVTAGHAPDEDQPAQVFWYRRQGS